MITVTRPQGEIALHVRRRGRHRLDVTVIDTRDSDPGWRLSVTGRSNTVATAVSSRVSHRTKPFIDSDGYTYAQQVNTVDAGVVQRGLQWSQTVASAAPSHGLGVATVVITDVASASDISVSAS